MTTILQVLGSRVFWVVAPVVVAVAVLVGRVLWIRHRRAQLMLREMMRLRRELARREEIESGQSESARWPARGIDRQ